MNVTDPQEKEKVLRLLQYLTKMVELRTRPVFDLRNYTDHVKLEELDAPLRNETAFLARVPRSNSRQPPSVPQTCALLVNNITDPESHPELEHFSTLEKDKREDVTEDWAKYLPSWKEWSREEKSKNSKKELYKKVFLMMEKKESSPELYELLLGVGLLRWENDKTIINRTLLTFPVSFDFHTSSGLIRIEPQGGPTLEEDMVENLKLPKRELLQDSFEKLKDLTALDHRDPQIQDFLTKWINSFHQEGAFIEEGDISKPSNVPTVELSPVLILRKRTQRPYLSMYQKLLTLTEKTDVPEGVIDLVSPRDNTDIEIDPDPRIYFPLPSNEEQKKIVARLASSRGVVVQGPPGTGKSHTIANLVSHLLAKGQRVLVTSHTDRALKVLKDKLPSEISELCVSAVGEGKEASRELERSLRALDRELSEEAWKNYHQRIVEDTEEELDNLSFLRQKTLETLTKSRLWETEQHTIGNHFGTPAKLVASLNENASWLGEVNENAELDASEIKQYLALMRQELSEKKLPLEPLSIEDFTHLSSIDKIKIPEETQALGTPLQQEALELFKRLKTDGEQIDFTFPWSEFLLKQAFNQKIEEIVLLQNKTSSVLNRLKNVPEGRIKGVTFASFNPELIYQINALVQDLENGGKVRRLGVLTSSGRKAKMLVDTVKVDGSEIDDLASAKKAQEALNVELMLFELNLEWNNQLDFNGTHARRLLLLENVMLTLGALENVARRSLRLRELNLSVSSLKDAEEQKSILLKDLMNQKVQETAFRLQEESQKWANASVELRTQAEKAFSEKSPSHYMKAMELYNSFEENNIKLSLLKNLEAKIETAAPQLSQELKSSYRSPIWEQRLETFEQHLINSKMKAFLDKTLPQDAFSKLTRDLVIYEEKELKLTSRLAASKAWLNALERVRPAQMQHLRAYQAATRRLGKGKGKSAFSELKSMQKHMRLAQSAVPAWIMPIYRAAESLDPSVDMFDVVIVDEASQSGVEALFLMWIAKKIVVVGDDKQISPDIVGIPQEAAENYQHQYLWDVPLADNFGIKSSLFDQASVRYGGRITLDEHFRCMPEIISFSNRLMYDGRLKPLKEYGSDRLVPLKHAFVTNASTSGSNDKKVNKAEAAALVQQIKECVHQEEYKGKTIGVISLLGAAQAQLIENMLIEVVGFEKMQLHKMRISDAPGFQGDEKDIVFLSLVSTSDPGVKLPALGDFKYFQRFNVAASRAQEQLWLFHSVTLEELNSACPRSLLLEHFLHPAREQALVFEQEVSRSEPHPKFDSLFEQNVFLDLKEKGLNVVPQWESMGKKIDLVVVGSNSRLAIECDGEKWHGPEHFEKDLARERQLQRVGWRFFRVRGSDYYKDPQKALAPLWPLLAERGITTSIHPKETLSLPSALEHYLRLLVQEEKESYARAYASFLLGKAVMPSRPDRMWVERVEKQILAICSDNNLT